MLSRFQDSCHLSDHYIQERNRCVGLIVVFVIFASKKKCKIMFFSIYIFLPFVIHWNGHVARNLQASDCEHELPSWRINTSSVATSSYPYLNDLYLCLTRIFSWDSNLLVETEFWICLLYQTDSFLNVWSLLLWNRSSEYTGHVLNKQ